MDQVAVHRTTVTVIGAGQAGLSAGYHLQNAGFVDAQQEPEAPKTFIMVDANQQPGGAWSHRWDSLTMGTVNGIFGLPGYPVPKTDPSEKSNQALPAYFSDYEEELGLPIIRPVHVQSVVRADNDPHGKLVITTNVGQWVSDYVINATGTWNNPLWPEYPGTETFQGTQLHTQDYVSGELFTGQRVAVVGAGISAIQHLDEISRHTTILWYTRREPEFISGPFRSEVEGRATIDKVTADAEAGKPTRSIVSYTGLE